MSDWKVSMFHGFCLWNRRVSLNSLINSQREYVSFPLTVVAFPTNDKTHEIMDFNEVVEQVEYCTFLKSTLLLSLISYVEFNIHSKNRDNPKHVNILSFNANRTIWFFSHIRKCRGVFKKGKHTVLLISPIEFVIYFDL